MKKNSFIKPLSVAFIALSAGTLTACTTNVSPDSYSAGAVGDIRRAERGEIESYRYVEIRTERGVGTAVGIGAGAAAGSTVGDGAGGVAGAIGGALIGGLLGNALDKEAGKKSGYEYVIRTAAGDLVTLVQADKSPLPKGAPILIVYSRGKSRIILDDARIENSYNDQQYELNKPEPGSREY